MDSNPKLSDTHMPTVEDQVLGHRIVPEPELSTELRAQRFELVCRDTAAQEMQRRLAGLPDPLPAPWPESTWQKLAELTQHVRDAK